MIKVAIIDDQMLILKGLQKLLANDHKVAITGLFTDTETLLEAFKKELPQVLILDLQMPCQSGIELAAYVATSYPSVKMIALTNVDVLIQMKEMLETGCLGYLLKDVKPAVLIQAIETVCNGEQFIDEAFKVQLLKSIEQQHEKNQITRREKEILKLLVQQNSHQQIANKLYLSLRTVENHQSNLLQKLNASSKDSLVQLAIAEGLV
jgi:DNA-binding NarL/FixJ family response regulator